MTAAMEMLGGGSDIAKSCRTPQIMADAAYVMLTRDSKSFTGNFAIDEEVLREEGCTDFTGYLAAPGMKEADLMPDFFLDLDNTPKEPMDELKAAAAAPAAAAPATNEKTVQGVFDKLGTLINDDLVSKVQAVYTFNVRGTSKSKKLSPPSSSVINSVVFSRLFQARMREHGTWI